LLLALGIHALLPLRIPPSLTRHIPALPVLRSIRALPVLRSIRALLVLRRTQGLLVLRSIRVLPLRSIPALLDLRRTRPLLALRILAQRIPALRIPPSLTRRLRAPCQGERIGRSPGYWPDHPARGQTGCLPRLDQFPHRIPSEQQPFSEPPSSRPFWPWRQQHKSGWAWPRSGVRTLRAPPRAQLEVYA